jgi:hypothetical protein
MGGIVAIGKGARKAGVSVFGWGSGGVGHWGEVDAGAIGLTRESGGE